MHPISYSDLSVYLKEAFKPATDYSGVIKIQGPDQELTWIQGHANKVVGTLLTVDTKFQIASITKQFTAVALLMALEKAGCHGDNLDEALHTPLSHYVPDFDAEWSSEVTLHQILTHTSGIENYTDFEEYLAIYRGENVRKNMVDYIKTLRQDPSKRGRFHYCNTGYYLLALVIENMTGMCVGDFMKQHIFSPLVMSDTSLPFTSTVGCLLKNRVITNMARGYTVNTLAPDFQCNEVSWYECFEVCYASGGIISTVCDLITWMRDLCKENTVIPKHIAERVLQKHIYHRKIDEDSWWYGYGVGVIENTNPRLNKFWHTGLVYGYESILTYYPNMHITLVNLSNCCNDFYERSKITRIIRKELEHIADEADQDKIIESTLDGRYPHRLAMLNRIDPRPVIHFEKFVKNLKQKENEKLCGLTDDPLK